MSTQDRNVTTWLQWGRDRAVPEMMGELLVATVQLELQWGRDRAVPEMGRLVEVW